MQKLARRIIVGLSLLLLLAGPLIQTILAGPIEGG
jgi:hypothetical protein